MYFPLSSFSFIDALFNMTKTLNTKQSHQHKKSIALPLTPQIIPTTSTSTNPLHSPLTPHAPNLHPLSPTQRNHGKTIQNPNSHGSFECDFGTTYHMLPCFHSLQMIKVLESKIYIFYNSLNKNFILNLIHVVGLRGVCFGKSWGIWLLFVMT